MQYLFGIAALIVKALLNKAFLTSLTQEVVKSAALTLTTKAVTQLVEAASSKTQETGQANVVADLLNNPSLATAQTAQYMFVNGAQKRSSLPATCGKYAED